MMPINGFEDTLLAVDMPTASDVAVLDLVEADVAQELLLEFSRGYLKVSVVHREGVDKYYTDELLRIMKF